MSDSFTLGKKTEYAPAPNHKNQNMQAEQASEQMKIARRAAENEISHQEVSAEMLPASETEYPDFSRQYQAAFAMIEDVILKDYLHHLKEYEIIPFREKNNNIDEIRLFRITEMVYQNQEYSAYKFASVFNSVQSLGCTIAVIADSSGERTEFYMGVRTQDGDKIHTAQSLKEILQNAFIGHFPGVRTEDLSKAETEHLLCGISSDNIASVSCAANHKDENFKSNESFIQGLEKLVLAMKGQKYTAVILARSVTPDELRKTRADYEEIYTAISPLSNQQFSSGENASKNISSSIQTSYSQGDNTAYNIALQQGKSISDSQGVSLPNQDAVRKKGIAGSIASLLGMGVAAAFPTGGVSIAAAGVLGALNTAVAMIPVPTETESRTVSTSKSITESITRGTNQSRSVAAAVSDGQTSGISRGLQLTIQDKKILNMMERIDRQLRRIDECESLGMWECAAYFLSDSPVTAEMAAGTYKAIIAGENSGVQKSACNLWSWQKQKECAVLHQYIKNLMHPVFQYHYQRNLKNEYCTDVSAASLVSSNELAIQMGLPRKSVCGFPVIEHAEFSQEVIKRNIARMDEYSKYDIKKVKISDKPDAFRLEAEKSGELSKKKESSVSVGKIYSMGECTSVNVALNCQRLTEHTFITGSTGAGKSNTTCQILHQLHEMSYSEKVHFLVIEPAKGEYAKDFPYAEVYDANPLEKTTNLLRLNPFYFPEEIHILHHLDRLVEIFNVCWPMYAAMPAILKKAMHNAYEASGWNMLESRNQYNYRIFPDFSDVLREIRRVVEDSDYSTDNKSDYTGSLVTRVESLTTGIFGMVFKSNGVPDSDLFDKNVIIDLSSIGSSETKSMIMGILVLKLQEYRMSQETEANSPLRHVTVLEEAHHLLKRTSTEQHTESSNLSGKSVEMLTNAIAEMRTYGEGFIIADQSPNLLDMAVIRNTNTKIIHRLPDYSDRELVGRAAGLNEEQVKELAKLEQGVAVIRQSDWLDSVLCKVNKYQKLKEIQRKKADEKIKITVFEYSFPDVLLTQFLVRTEPKDLEKFRNEVLSSDLSGGFKADFLKLVSSRTEDECQKNWQKIFYDMFSLGKIMKKFKDVKENNQFIYDMILKQFPPSLLDYDGLEGCVQLKGLVNMMMHEQVDRDMTYNRLYEEMKPLFI